MGLVPAHRDAHGHIRTFAIFAINGDRAVHGLDQLLDDAHAETRSFDMRRTLAGRALEWIKDFRQKFRRHADAVVPATKNERYALSLRFLPDRDMDLAAVVCVFDGVVDDIYIDLPQPQRVAVQILGQQLSG